jgi:NAD(P)-dependent dehydrogenase (short-subunit alcohol dehydrogenase family)
MSILERFSLSGRIALVSGGAGPQFGSSISQGLAEAGSTVITASRSLERNRQFAQSLADQGHDVHGMQLDLGRPESVQQLAEQIQQQFGRLDILVNSALGRGGYGKALDEQTSDDWAAAANTDMVGLFHMCRTFLPMLEQSGHGSLINISSIYGVLSNDPGLYLDTDMKQPPNYNFVKAGMINFTRYLATYYGRRGVRCNTISPGGYYNDQPEPFLNAYCQRVPIGRMLNHDDLQGAVVFLASDASQYVTGHNLMVDGGWSAI